MYGNVLGHLPDHQLVKQCHRDLWLQSFEVFPCSKSFVTTSSGHKEASSIPMWGSAVRYFYFRHRHAHLLEGYLEILNFLFTAVAIAIDATDFILFLEHQLILFPMDFPDHNSFHCQDIFSKHRS